MKDERFDALKRRFYLIALVLAGVAALAEQILRTRVGHVAIFETSVEMVFAPTSFALAALLWWRKDLIRVIERLLYVVATAVLLLKLFSILFIFNDGGNEAARFFPWFVINMMMPFLFFSAKGALCSSLFVYVTALGFGIIHMIPAFVGSGHSIEEFQPLIQLYLASGTVIVFMGIYSQMKEAYLQTRSDVHRMSALAQTDYLTGGWNRRHLAMLLSMAINQSAETGSSFSLIMFDLDHFKRINDTYGHDAGDRVLQEVARLVQKQIRNTDEFGRWGGEEFLIIAKETDFAQADQAARRVRESINSLTVDQIGGVTASFGVAVYQQGDTVEALLKRVDDALYLAKRKGRNRVEIALSSGPAC